MVDQCDPALMFTIPRLAIVAGLLIYPQGPLSLDASPHLMSEMFRPFRVSTNKNPNETKLFGIKGFKALKLLFSNVF